MRPVSLSAGRLKAVILPEIGASLVGLWQTSATGDREILRSTRVEEVAAQGPRASAMYPLVPFANRLRENRLIAGDRIYPLSPNVPEQKLVLHGDAWLKPWAVMQQDPSSVLLALNSSDPSWPYRYTATKRFTLRPDQLTVEIDVVNEGEALPFGIGFHPYFPRHPTTLLRFSAARVWLEDENFLPSVAVDPAEFGDFRQPNALPFARINNCYGGWDGTVEIFHRGLAPDVRMTASGTGFLMVFSPSESTFMALEPQTHGIAAFSDPANPAPLLANAGRISASMTIEVV